MRLQFTNVLAALKIRSKRFTNLFGIALSLLAIKPIFLGFQSGRISKCDVGRRIFGFHSYAIYVFANCRNI